MDTHQVESTLMRNSIALAASAVFLLAGCTVKEDADEQQASQIAANDENTVSSAAVSGSSNSEAMPLDITQTHVNGTTLRLGSIEALPSETHLTLTIENGFDQEVNLNGSFGTYIFGPDGTKLELKAPENNEDLEIPPGQNVRADLVFEGKLAKGGPATLFINNAQYMENKATRYPGFRIPINLDDTAYAANDSQKKK